MTLWSCGQVLDNGMRAIGRSGAATYSNLCGLAAAVPAAVVLTSRWGIAGTGAAMCLGQAVSLAAKVWALAGCETARVRDFLGVSFADVRGALKSTLEA